MKTRTLILAIAAMLIVTAAHAGDCLNIDDGAASRNIPPVTVTLSGHITNYYENHANVEADGETGDGRYLLLDTSIEVNSGDGCTNWNAIHINGSEEQLVKSSPGTVLGSTTRSRPGFCSRRLR